MDNSLKERAERRLNRQRRRRIRNRVVWIAAAVVVFTTAYLLMMPAVTLEGQKVCGLEEHQHTDACYQAARKKIVCTPQEGVLHQHTAECYDEEKNLICPWQENIGTTHTHDESCYIREDETVSEKTVCGLEEVQEHIHTEKCFEQQERVLICGKQEHIHTQECLEKETETKAAVVETETEAGETETAAEETETAAEEAETAASTEKNRQETAKETEEETAEETEKEAERLASGVKVSRAIATEDGLELEDADIEKVKMFYLNENDDWVEITDATGNIPGNAKIKLEVSYHNVNIEELLRNQARLLYTLPSILVNPSGEGTVTAMVGTEQKTVGTISLSNNCVQLAFETDYLNGVQGSGQTVIAGTFSVAGYLDWDSIKDKDTLNLTIGGVTITLNFESDMQAKYSAVDIEKSVGEVVSEEEDGDYLTYTLTATAGEKGALDVSVVDTFTANASYIQEYAGVTAAEAPTNQEGGPQETVPEGKDKGKVYIGSLPTEENPIPQAGNEAVEKPGAMVWHIGDMAANETRTLTYKVKLKEGYTGINRVSTLANRADAYSETYPKSHDTADFTPSAGMTMEKSEGVYRRDPEGGGIITYTIWVQAYETNSYTMDNVRLDDSMNHSNSSGKTADELLPFLEYVEDSIHVYEGTKEDKTAKGKEILVGGAPVIDNGTAKKFSFYIGDLKPGEVRVITYDVKVDEEAFTQNNELLVKNRAEIFSDDSRDDGGEQLNAWGRSTKIYPKRWNRKIVSTALGSEQTILIPENSSVYEYVGGALQAGVSPESFTVSAGSFPYTVVVNEAGDWNLSNTTFGDTLINNSGDYLRFTGYMKVEAYTVNGEDSNPQQTDNAALTGVQGGTLAKTVWVKVDDAQSFSFQPSELGISGTYAYVLSYYGKPHDVNVASANVNNRFSLTGNVVGPGGETYGINGVYVDVSVVVQDNSNFGAEKLAWYFEQPRENPAAGYEKGTLYWVIKASGNRITSQVRLKDCIQSQVKNHSLLSDAVVGVYKGALPSEVDSLTAYSSLKTFQEGLEENPDMSELVNGEDYVWSLNSSKEGILEFKKAIELGQGESVYVIVKTAKIIDIADKTAQYTCFNDLKSSGDGGASWSNDGQVSLVATESGSGYKESQGVYTWDGTQLETLQGVQAGASARSIQTDALTQPGTYLAWQVEVNWAGTLSGTAEVLDELPSGLELVYVELYARASGYSGQTPPSTPQIQELEDAGWERKERNGTIAYYDKESGQVRWNVEGLLEGAKKTRNVTFQLVCRLTDKDALLGEEKTFLNRLSVKNEYGDEDVDYDDVTLSRQNLGKEGNYSSQSGAVYPFTITINPFGEDLIAGEGNDEITLIDELGSSLILDTSSIRIYNTSLLEAEKEKDEADRNMESAQIDSVSWKAEVVQAQDGSQTLRLTVPDNQPLTITYNTLVNAAPGQKVSISNVAHWEGYSSPQNGTVQQDNFQYETSGTVGGQETPALVVTKLDQSNTSIALEGAVFALREVAHYDADAESFSASTNTSEHTAITNGQGKAAFPENSSWTMEFNTIYSLTETSAPEGYVADMEPVYLAIAKEVDGKYPDFAKYSEETNKKVNVWYMSANYQYTAYNHKGKAKVVKNFQDKDGNPLVGNPPNGAYRFGLYGNVQTPAQSGQAADPLQILTITYTDGEVSYDRDGVTVDAPEFTNLSLDTSYYIYELDDKNQPIVEEDSAVVNGRNYKVSYADGVSVTATADDLPSVTVTNKAEVFLLPESGGEGVYGYLLAGMSLVGAALLLMYKKKKGRGEA